MVGVVSISSQLFLLRRKGFWQCCLLFQNERFHWERMLHVQDKERNPSEWCYYRYSFVGKTVGLLHTPRNPTLLGELTHRSTCCLTSIFYAFAVLTNFLPSPHPLLSSLNLDQRFLIGSQQGVQDTTEISSVLPPLPLFAVNNYLTSHLYFLSETQISTHRASHERGIYFPFCEFVSEF
mmetsp:Transcript_45014/g.51717  ORF Transcript_45014/g.51717 Transcript_45014/m.51717 type:complete len:179 (-) Transcript_45014:452-988(-)